MFINNNLNEKKQSEMTESSQKKTPFLFKLRNSLSKVRQVLGHKIMTLCLGQQVNTDFFEKIEESLLIADFGVKTTHLIIEYLIKMTQYNRVTNTETVYTLLQEKMKNMLSKIEKPLIITSDNVPFIILIIGANGVGKTTTIGKLANKLTSEGKKVLLAGGDTFRAAGKEQLQILGESNRIPVITREYSNDAASVIFNAMHIAKKQHYDILIIDTAGRLHNKINLMNEMKKIIRVIKKIDIEAPHEAMLIIDASIGQNSLSQISSFNEFIPLTGITITKLDGTAKGGVIFTIADQFGIPVRYIGTGEDMKDIQVFKSEQFVDFIFPKLG
ncbi:signal recognition particle-docking protein FtsY [Candidatus Schneideria nysicola]|uniref:signal recognition particle-docking protein FtsY n=1 Tax=Candidatus Schneideria nysicola TaxID=1081631 RepID=UPI001CAA585E|nr:signal recognition particle-docking protein FtsY [Candidatus Schneideria nysicola]UAJ65423.1 signal recognition particle-docking protein FtsY [Candidatus Schneideria nysicola]